MSINFIACNIQNVKNKLIKNYCVAKKIHRKHFYARIHFRVCEKCLSIIFI